jgi:DNA-binding beta-propeller fold protein YncE
MTSTTALDGGPQGSPVEGPLPGQPPAGAPPARVEPADEEERRRRRRFFLLILLGLLAAFFLLIVLWYLIFRQPLPLPIPPAPEDEAPAYSFAIYDVTKPLSVAVSRDGGRIYVTQSEGTQETLMLDGRGRPIGTLQPPATLTTHATQLYLAIDPLSGEVYASDRLAGQVYVYAADGSFARRFDPGLSLAGWQPLAVAFDTQGNLYVSDAAGTTQLIHEFDRDGKRVRDFGKPGALDFANGIAIDTAGNVYVSDTNDGRLLVYDPNGAEIGVIGRGPAKGELGLPVGIAIDGQGRVFIVDSVTHAVQVYRVLASGERSPAYLTSFGVEGTTDGAFEYPNGIALDGRGRVYVADWNNDRIQVWSY